MNEETLMYKSMRNEWMPEYIIEWKTNWPRIHLMKEKDGGSGGSRPWCPLLPATWPVRTKLWMKLFKLSRNSIFLFLILFNIRFHFVAKYYRSSHNFLHVGRIFFFFSVSKSGKASRTRFGVHYKIVMYPI